MSVNTTFAGTLAPVHARFALSDTARARVASLVVIGAALLPFLFILPLANQPITRDEGAYLTIGRGLFHGQLPYRDLFDHKPPLVYAWYASSLAIFGDRPAAPRMAGALCLSATVLITASCGARLYGRRACWITALAMGGMTSIAALQWGFNTETFMLPLMSGSLLALLRAKENGGGGTAWAFVAGLTGGLAVLTKSVAVFNLMVVVLFPLFSPSFGTDWRRRSRRSMTVVAGAGVAGILVCLPFLLVGATRDLFYANVTYNQLYGAEVGLAARLSMSWRSVLTFIIFAGPFAFLAFVATIGSLGRRSSEDRLLLLWTGASAIGVVATGHFFLHYYAQLIPGLALLIGSLSIARIPLRSTVTRSLVAILILVSSVQFIRTNLGPIYLGTVETRLGQMELDELVAQRTAEGPAVGEYLADHMGRNDTIYNFGRETQLYYYANATPAAPDLYDRRLWLDPQKFQPTLDALRKSPPTYIVDTSTYGDIVIERPAELVQLIQDAYVYETTIDFAVIYRLRSSSGAQSLAVPQADAAGGD